MNQTRLTFLGGHLATRAVVAVCTYCTCRPVAQRQFVSETNISRTFHASLKHPPPPPTALLVFVRHRAHSNNGDVKRALNDWSDSCDSFNSSYSRIPAAPWMDTVRPTCHIRSFIKGRTGGEGGWRIPLVGWVTQGTFSFVWRTAYGAKCQQAYLHTVCLCVPLSFAHSN